MRRLFILLLMMGLALVPGKLSFAQEIRERAIFHVTAVRSEEAKDWCTTGKCSAKKFTVEGYTDSVEYVLECVEVVAHEPSLHWTAICDHVQSHRDYNITLGTQSIVFGESQQSSDSEPHRMAYMIVSEKEKSSHRQ